MSLIFDGHPKLIVLCNCCPKLGKDDDESLSMLLVQQIGIGSESMAFSNGCYQLKKIIHASYCYW